MLFLWQKIEYLLESVYLQINFIDLYKFMDENNKFISIKLSLIALKRLFIFDINNQQKSWTIFQIYIVSLIDDKYIMQMHYITTLLCHCLQFINRFHFLKYFKFYF